eukprot:gnl/MRDRNA2_/MRDRNA2_114307_c0_seq1.p1 gnl/MRDRNA2_/MRDRNA2_114307_c0~~gnl/MRDRNA2_/MRDRNA2_114307_c0_seq1.p1  ORF type:complete len:376 (+),score=44.95 gnl/MRDRNA2_/MRDRNA2_114307_c0_seq1:106-1128(+)
MAFLTCFILLVPVPSSMVQAIKSQSASTSISVEHQQWNHKVKQIQADKDLFALTSDRHSLPFLPMDPTSTNSKVKESASGVLERTSDRKVFSAVVHADGVSSFLEDPGNSSRHLEPESRDGLSPVIHSAQSGKARRSFTEVDNMDLRAQAEYEPMMSFNDSSDSAAKLMIGGASQSWSDSFTELGTTFKDEHMELDENPTPLEPSSQAEVSFTLTITKKDNPDCYQENGDIRLGVIIDHRGGRNKVSHPYVCIKTHWLTGKCTRGGCINTYFEDQVQKGDIMVAISCKYGDGEFLGVRPDGLSGEEVTEITKDKCKSQDVAIEFKRGGEKTKKKNNNDRK